MISKNQIYLSVVIPFYNEEDCIINVYEELHDSLTSKLDKPWEIILVNDGSTDQTTKIINQLSITHKECKAIHLRQNSGQSAALEAGFTFAKGALIATLDGDGQNDPEDIHSLLYVMESKNTDMICGIRSIRKDNIVRKLSSRLANNIRSNILKDNITDVGCSTRIFKSECLSQIKFFRNAHRFFPALFIMAGFKVSETHVNHRPRAQGVSKYGAGINSRLWVGIIDLVGVYWMRKRFLKYQVIEYVKQNEK